MPFGLFSFVSFGPQGSRGQILYPSAESSSDISEFIEVLEELELCPLEPDDEIEEEDVEDIARCRKSSSGRPSAKALTMLHKKINNHEEEPSDATTTIWENMGVKFHRLDGWPRQQPVSVVNFRLP